MLISNFSTFVNPLDIMQKKIYASIYNLKQHNSKFKVYATGCDLQVKINDIYTHLTLGNHDFYSVIPAGEPMQCRWADGQFIGLTVIFRKCAHRIVLHTCEYLQTDENFLQVL